MKTVRPKDGARPSEDETVIPLTRLNGNIFVVNPDLLERAESTPDTVVTLVDGSRIVVLESIEELTELIIVFRGPGRGRAPTSCWMRPAPRCPPATSPTTPTRRQGRPRRHRMHLREA